MKIANLKSEAQRSLLASYNRYRTVLYLTTTIREYLLNRLNSSGSSTYLRSSLMPANGRSFGSLSKPHLTKCIKRLETKQRVCRAIMRLIVKAGALGSTD